MESPSSTATRIIECIGRFLDSCGRETAQLGNRTNLASGLGLSSDEGLDLVLDLCEEFDFDFPNEFNPVVHRDGKRGNTVNELTHEVHRYMAAAGVEA